MIYKHRDYLHDTFLEHLLANDGHVKVNPEPVMVAINPVTGVRFNEPVEYYTVEIEMDDKMYVYLVPSKTRGKPSKSDIAAALIEYLKNPTREPRNVEDYLVQ